MKVAAIPNEVDRRIRGVNEFEVDHLFTSSKPGIEIRVSELKRESDALRVKADAGVQVLSTKLRYYS
jgi:hypothetical protein